MNSEKPGVAKKPFYGWVVLGALFVIYAASNGIGLNTLPVFLPYLMQEFNLDPAKASTLPGVLFFTIAILAPFVGRLLDRVRVRRLFWMGSAGMVLLLFLFPFVQSYGQLVAFYVLYAVCLTLAGILTSVFVLNRWFKRYIGIAIGIFLIASSLGSILFVQIASRAIAAYGWRTAALIVAFTGVLAILLPVLLLRDRPEDVGTTPDGIDTAMNPLTGMPAADNPGAVAGMTLGQAASTPTFYLLLTMTAVLWFCIAGFLQHQGVFLKRDLLLDPVTLGNVSSILFGLAIGGKLLFGWLADKFPKKIITILAILSLGVGTAFLKLSLVDSSWIIPFAVAYGLGYSAAFTMIQVFSAELYGGRHFGSIYGIITMVDTLASTGGIVMLGTLRKTSGSYGSSFDLMLGLCALGLLATLLIRKPKPVKAAVSFT